MRPPEPGKPGLQPVPPSRRARPVAQWWPKVTDLGDGGSSQASPQRLLQPPWAPRVFVDGNESWPGTPLPAALLSLPLSFEASVHVLLFLWKARDGILFPAMSVGLTEITGKFSWETVARLGQQMVEVPSPSPSPTATRKQARSRAALPTWGTGDCVISLQS